MSPSLANLQVFITSCGGSTSITVTTSILQGLHEQEKTLLHEWRKKTYRHGKDLMKGMRFRHSKAWYFTVTVQHQTLRPDNNLMRTQDFQGRARSAKLMGTFWLPPIPTASFFLSKWLFLLHLGPTACSQLFNPPLLLSSSSVSPLLCILYKLALVCVSSVGTGV